MTAVPFSEITAWKKQKASTRHEKLNMMNEKKRGFAPVAGKILEKSTKTQFVQYAWRNSTSIITGKTNP